MSIRTQSKDSKIRQLSTRLVILSLLFSALVGCAPRATQHVDPITPVPPTSLVAATAPLATTLPADWETSTGQGQCGYAISHPASMDLTSEGPYSWTFSFTSTEPSGLVPNFVYISVIPDGFQGGEDGSIYNYNPADTATLLSMQVGESRSLREDPNLGDLAAGFRYTRLPDITLSNLTAQTYENTQPWEFPAGTKEIRYYLQSNGCTYLIGGYFSTVGSGQPGAISQELFDEIMATFQVNS